MAYLFTLLLVCVRVLYITSTAGSYYHGHPHLIDTNTHSEGQLEPHKIFKREGGFNQYLMCNPIVESESCTNGQSQEIARMSQRCNDPLKARKYQNGCMQNDMGNYCGMDAGSQRSKINRACKSSLSCSSECKEVLLSTRSELGCCANVFNDSVLYGNTAQFSYSLWSRCNVEQVTEECRPSTIRLSPTTSLDSTCNTETLQLRMQSALCREEYVEGIRNRLSATERCQNYTHLPIRKCNANGNEAYCDTLIVNSDNYTAATERCGDTSTCDPHCIETLNNIINAVGCCFIDRYNSTESNRFDWLSNEFWSRCGLESPGFCEEYLNNAAMVLKAGITYAITVAMILLWSLI